MAVTLSSQEVAALTGKTERTVRRWAESGKIPAERVLNKFNSPEYLFSLDALEPHLQQKYFDGLKLTPSPEVAQTLTKEAKPLDTYSIEEQEEIAFWLRLVKQWQGYRNKPGANKTEVDANFVQWCKLEYPERAISVDTLYRRWNAVRDNDLDGLIDKRGKWKKGKSSIPDPMWQAFLYFYLDERQHPLKKCYEYTKLEMQTSFPELVGDMPSYTTFYRRAQADIPEPLKVLGREGEKAFRDRCAPYIRRVYDDMRSNEWWIADNHTFDIITEGENGQRHRLYLTAFFDARSGIFTGCYVTNAPSSQSTLIALRRGILKYGIPENIYVDNVFEYASVFQSELDKAAVEQATSGWMELNDKLVRYNGGAEVKIPSMDMDGLADYDRDKGFVEGSVNLKWETKEMTQDRGRQFTFDENEVNETNFVVTAAQVMGEFQRTKVIPEIDAYRYSKIASLCIAKERAGYEYTPTENDILKKLYYDIAAVQDVVGDETPLVITMARPVAAILDMSSTLSKSLSVMDFKQGDVTVKVKSLNGEFPIIRVGSGRMKTSYQFYDGTTSTQEKGGFAAAEDAKDINWIISPRTAPIAVSRTDKVRIFDPETYQKKRAWATDYRKYHDLWVPDNKLTAMWVNIKQAKAGGRDG